MARVETTTRTVGVMPSRGAVVRAACELLETSLRGSKRQDIVDVLLGSGDGAEALRRLRRAMRAHTFTVGSETLEFEGLVRKLDTRTRHEGFRVLHTWDHLSHRFTDDIVPVLMLDDFARTAGEEPARRVTIEILLDCYFLHVLVLCAMRVWDDEDPDEMLDRVTTLVGDLQGLDGSGHRFLDNAETLIIYALSQFHPEETAYDRLIERIVTLGQSHRTTFALASVSVLGCHLRWGFWLMYERDVLRMRNDNVGDYPWLLDSVLTLMRDYARLCDASVDDAHRADVVVGLLQGLAADPWAFAGKEPPALSEYEAEYAELRALLERHGGELLDELEGCRPSKEKYSPLSLHFNFPHNTLVAIVAMALLAGQPQQLPLNALFVRERARGESPARDGWSEDEPAPDGLPGGASAQETLARALMSYSGASPDRLGIHGAMLVAYDPYSGLRSFTMTVDTIRKSLSRA